MLDEIELGQVFFRTFSLQPAGRIVILQVTVVGHVVSIQSQATNNLYWLDDGTGRIEARHWIDSSIEETGLNIIT
jgi:hypothetical protein